MFPKLKRIIVISFISWISVGSLSRCGDDGNAGTRPSPPIVVSEGNFSIGSTRAAAETGDRCVALEFIEFRTSVAGTIQAIVDWTYSRNDLDAAIIRGTCTCQDVKAASSLEALNEACPLIAESVSPTEKPEVVSVPGQKAGTYTLIVANFQGNEGESGSYQVILTPFS